MQIKNKKKTKTIWLVEAGDGLRFKDFCLLSVREFLCRLLSEEFLLGPRMDLQGQTKKRERIMLSPLKTTLILQFGGRKQTFPQSCIAKVKVAKTVCSKSDQRSGKLGEPIQGRLSLDDLIHMERSCGGLVTSLQDHSGLRCCTSMVISLLPAGDNIWQSKFSLWLLLEYQPVEDILPLPSPALPLFLHTGITL